MGGHDLQRETRRSARRRRRSRRRTAPRAAAAASRHAGCRTAQKPTPAMRHNGHGHRLAADPVAEPAGQDGKGQPDQAAGNEQQALPGRGVVAVRALQIFRPTSTLAGDNGEAEGRRPRSGWWRRGRDIPAISRAPAKRFPPVWSGSSGNPLLRGEALGLGQPAAQIGHQEQRQRADHVNRAPAIGQQMSPRRRPGRQGPRRYNPGR